MADRPIASATAERIDLKGITVMPGLIDAHVHVMAVDAALARLAEEPLSLVTLQAGRVLDGDGEHLAMIMKDGAFFKSPG